MLLTLCLGLGREAGSPGQLAGISATFLSIGELRSLPPLSALMHASLIEWPSCHPASCVLQPRSSSAYSLSHHRPVEIAIYIVQTRTSVGIASSVNRAAPHGSNKSWIAGNLHGWCTIRWRSWIHALCYCVTFSPPFYSSTPTSRPGVIAVNNTYPMRLHPLLHDDSVSRQGSTPYKFLRGQHVQLTLPLNQQSLKSI